MNQPVFSPNPSQILASTDLRQHMSQTFSEINDTKGAMVVTVANQPRIVISDYTTYSELLYQSRRS